MDVSPTAELAVAALIAAEPDNWVRERQEALDLELWAAALTDPDS